jgi:hypothetical protein
MAFPNSLAASIWDAKLNKAHDRFGLHETARRGLAPAMKVAGGLLWGC